VITRQGSRDEILAEARRVADGLITTAVTNARKE